MFGEPTADDIEGVDCDMMEEFLRAFQAFVLISLQTWQWQRLNVTEAGSFLRGSLRG